MDQCRHRRWPLHRVGQPCMQQKLCGFTHCAHKQQQTGQSHSIPVTADKMKLLAGRCANCREHAVESNGIGENKNQKNAQCKPEITHTVDNKGFHCSGIGRRLFIPEADKEVRRKAHAFPAKEHLHQIICCHQHQHRKGKQRQIAKETRTGRVLMHVAD